MMMPGNMSAVVTSQFIVQEGDDDKPGSRISTL